MARRPELPQDQPEVPLHAGEEDVHHRVELNPRRLGVLNNRRFLSHYVGENPLTATIKFPAINLWPIIAPWDHPLLISIATVYAEARYHYGGIANVALKKAIIAGETLSPKLPAIKISPEQEARASIVTWMQVGLFDDIFTTLGDYDDASYQNFKNTPDVLRHFPARIVPENYPFTQNQVDNLTPEQAVFTMFFFGSYLRASPRQLAIENITLAYCALAKRGQVTDEFCTKIQTSVRDELGVTVVLNQPALTALYKSYMMGVDNTNAAEIFNDLDALIPDVALRLKLTLQQASGSGMTLYVIIGRAMRMYYEFPWGRINTLTGGELRNWQQARDLINDNLYYGFKRDMGAAKSTLYKSLGYVARELLIKINGERTLLRYAGLGGNIKNKNALDRLINAFVETYVAIEGEETEAEREILPTQASLNANQLFA